MDKATSNYGRALPLIWVASQLQPSTDEALDVLVTREMGNGLVVNYVLGEMGNLRYLRETDLSKVRMTRGELRRRKRFTAKQSQTPCFAVMDYPGVATRTSATRPNHGRSHGCTQLAHPV
jgi:hypothetical protein